MDESRQVLPLVLRKLESDERFADLSAFVSTGCCIVVHGRVRSEQDEHRLRSSLDEIEFPHGVKFLVGVK